MLQHQKSKSSRTINSEYKTPNSQVRKLYDFVEIMQCKQITLFMIEYRNMFTAVTDSVCLNLVVVG